MCTARPQKERNDNDVSNVLTLEEVVRLLPEESVKAALRDHLAPKYREGVFEHGRNAIESIRHVDPELATKLVDAAYEREVREQELKKRADNSTTSSSPPG